MYDEKKLQRWKPRSHCTKNMGLSAKRASTVPLVLLNLDNGYINSQLNIVFDDWFTTLAASLKSLPDLKSPDWSKIFGESTFQFRFDDESDGDIEERFFDSNQDLPEPLDHLHKAVSSTITKHRPDIPLLIVPYAEKPVPPAPLPISLLTPLTNCWTVRCPVL